QMSDDDLLLDRGAHFGSILATLNHLLWGDALWMCRWSEVPKPTLGAKDALMLTASGADWADARASLDAAILNWADGLTDKDVAGDLTWYSGLLKRDMTMERALCIMHFFNHQTHHRGQVHAMLTAAGQRPGDTDLFLMPA
ncbi:MAG: DinB family protein, partial [Deltaproteobacteria bacterium]